MVRRQPNGPVEWPGGQPCTQIPGGCFPDDEPPILGPEPFYSFGGTPVPKGFTYPGSQPSGGQQKAEIQLAIKQIALYDQDNICQPIIADLLKRLNSGGIWVAPDMGVAAGRWANKENGKGTIYISTRPGDNWNEDGTVNRQLRKTLTEEGIHAYFDTDVSHVSGATQEQRAAMQKMRDVCGKFQ